MIKREKIKIYLGKKNIINDFSVKKNKKVMIELFRFYRLLIMIKLLKAKKKLNANKLLMSYFLKYRSNLRFLAINVLIQYLKIFMKQRFNKNKKYLKKTLAKLILIMNLKNNLILEKRSNYINRLPRFIKNDDDVDVDINDKKKIYKKEEKEKRKKKLILRKLKLKKQKPLKDEIKLLKPVLLKLYQNIGQRKGFVFKKKILNLRRSSRSLALKIKKIIFFLFFRRFYRKKRIFWRKRFFLKKHSFKEMWDSILDSKMFLKFKKFKKLFKRRKRKFLFNFKKMKKYKRLYRKKRTAILHFKSYYSNYYITLTDLSYRVIFSCSAGSVSLSNNKKTKTSTVVCTPMFFQILPYLKMNRIKNLKFEVKDSLDKYFFNAFEFFRKRRFKIKTISFVLRAAHHLGQRKNKPRRV